MVGSGPGGGPTAARLALAGYSVLLIEAGEDHGTDRQVRVPALHPIASEYTPIRWDYYVQHYADEEQAKRDDKMTYMTPDGEYYSGLDPPEGSEMLGILYPRNGALGGCTQHNALVSILPNNNDWDYIANITGDNTWEATNMRQYFEKLEKCEYLPNSISGHGFDGWLPTATTPLYLVAEDQKVLSIVIAAATAMGMNVVDKAITTVTGLLNLLTLDINNDSPDRDRGEALYQIPLSVDGTDYTRASTRDWLYDIYEATNSDGSKKYKLDIALNTLATKINFDTTGDKPKATGVDYLYGKSVYRADPRASKESNDGTKGTAHASKEVIVSGGTFNTPQLLKLSGVGPAEELESFGIDVVADLPGVGGNMQDRYEMAVIGQGVSDFALLKECKFLQEDDDPCYDQWSKFPGAAKGAYTTNGIAFAYIHHSSVAEDDPDLLIGAVPANFRGYWPHYSVNAVATRDKWSWWVLKTHSRNNAGTVNLTSTNPRDMPQISFNSFSKGGDEDVQALYEGMSYAIDAFDSVIPIDGTFDRIWPPQNVSSEDELKQMARDEAWGHHASCTCPIGADDDPLAVLDGDFRVRKVDGLRVVDASIFPKIPGTFPVLPIYMAAEKAAEVIIAADKS